MEEIVFATYVTDNNWLEQRAKPLEASARFFHPEIPFKIFTPDEVIQLSKRCPYLPHAPHGCTKAIMGMELAKDFENVVLLDADSLIVARLTEVIDFSYGLAGVRAFTDHGALQHIPPEHPGIQAYEALHKREKHLNGGFLACRDKSFWHSWDELNRLMVKDLFNWEEGTMNRLAYDKYKDSFLLLDPPEVPYYYGIAATWGTKTAWDSWGRIQLEDEKLYLENVYGVRKQVKILHEAAHGQAGSPDGRFDLKRLFTKPVSSFLERISDHGNV